MEVVGFKKIVAKSNGVRYVEFHCLSDDKYVTGQRAECVFVREDMVDSLDLLCIGCHIEVSYNRFGRVDCVSIFN